MFFPPSVGSTIIERIKPIWESDAPDSVRAFNMYITLAGLQSLLLGNVLVEKIGNKIYSGPFKGMTLIKEAQVGYYVPVLLGCYEYELHEVVEKIIARQYKQILNIGCSHGYYATGLAQRMPQTMVHAFDIDPIARTNCANTAATNGVGDRVSVGGEFKGEDYEKYLGPETFVVMDIEGAEMDLLDPIKYPALKNMDVLVELHEMQTPGISNAVVSRFLSTHDVVFIKNQPKQFPLNDIFGSNQHISHLDYMIASWEGRIGPTPWAFMTRKGKYAE